MEDGKAGPRSDPERPEERANAAACRRAHAIGEVLLWCREAHGRDEIELATDLMARRARPFGIAHPVTDERIRILANVGYDPRNAGQAAEHRDRERRLREDREQHRAVEGSCP